MTIVILIIILFIVMFIATTYNKLVKARNKVKEAFSTMDVFLKKRWSLIPNVVETVKGYAKHEMETLEEVINLRNGASYDKMSDEEKIKANTAISSGVSKIFALAESYPDLKASENFKDLSDKLQKVEEDIATSRKYYNAVVRDYNNIVEVVPSNLVAMIFGFKTSDMFEISEAEREDVKVKF